MQTQHKYIARILRKNSTAAERWLWDQLRNRNLAGWKFRRQHRIGPYVADFVCIEKNLVVEVDGGQHATNVEEDKNRSDYFGKKGFRILRFWNDQVLREREAILELIFSHLNEAPSPRPSPPKRRREKEEGEKYQSTCPIASKKIF